MGDAPISILSVGAGDIKLSFDKNNPAECIRAGRIIKDMLRRGYALMCESGKKHADGSAIYTRVKEFDEATCEYIVVDFDPVSFLNAEQGPTERIPTHEPSAAPSGPTRSPKTKPKSRAGGRRIHAAETRTVAISRSAGG